MSPSICVIELMRCGLEPKWVRARPDDLFDSASQREQIAVTMDGYTISCSSPELPESVLGMNSSPCFYILCLSPAAVFSRVSIFASRFLATIRAV